MEKNSQGWQGIISEAHKEFNEWGDVLPEEEGKILCGTGRSEA